jgi:hypothetical protein
VNVSDLANLADCASVMRSNGVHRARFNEDGSLAECELDPKYTPPDEKPPPRTPMDMAVERDEAKKALAAFRLKQDRLLFLASEGVPDEELEP